MLGDAFKDTSKAFLLGKQIGELDFDIKIEEGCVETSTEVEKNSFHDVLENRLKEDPDLVKHSDSARLGCVKKYLELLIARRPLVQRFFRNSKVPPAELIKRLELLSGEMLGE